MNNSEITISTILSSGIMNPINPECKKIAGIAGVDRGTYFEYVFDRGTDFVSAIDIQSELYFSNQSNAKREFLFRGHADANWPLIPSAYRMPSRGDIGEQYNGVPTDFEIMPFIRFLEEVNNLGFFIEDESLALIETSKANKKYLAGGWPRDQFNNSRRFFPTKSQMRMLALAQHYGVPTRLLDWTSNPYIGAFFAINSIKGLQGGNERVGLWVVSTLLLDAVQAARFLEFVEVPKFQNANIVAQQGVFTNYVPSLDFQDFKHRLFPINDSEDGLKTFDAYLCETDINETLDDIITKVTGKPMLFTLPHSEVGIVHQKLEQLNISWTTMMPSLEGATKEALRKGLLGR